MSDFPIREFLEAITALSALSAAFLSYMTKQQVEVTKVKVEEVHKATNSMQDKLIDATAIASKAEGKAEGIALGLQQAKDKK